MSCARVASKPCRVPCVVMGVGDSAWIVGESGRVVPARDAEALARAWRELVEIGPEGRATLGTAARARIVEKFSLHSIVAQYEKLYQSVLTQKAGERVGLTAPHHHFAKLVPANERHQDAGSGGTDVEHSALLKPRR